MPRPNGRSSSNATDELTHRVASREAPREGRPDVVHYGTHQRADCESDCLFSGAEPHSMPPETTGADLGARASPNTRSRQGSVVEVKHASRSGLTRGRSL